MEDEYKEIVRKFEEIYRPLRKRYNLRSHMHFSIYDDGLIEIWEYRGETKGKCILRVKETESVDCYKRAIEELNNYKKEREEAEHGRSAAMAV